MCVCKFFCVEMRKVCFAILCVLFIWNNTALARTNTKTVKLKVVETSDVHGHFFPFDFMLRTKAKGSLARIHTYVQKERETYGDNLLLIDNGDVLQGQPTSYYYNYIDTVSSGHTVSRIMNYMGYNVGNVGNHDIETGYKVFNRWVRDCNFPILGANVIDTSTDEPYLKPYEVIERQGVKIVVMGMITPAVPVWLPENLWSGLRFDDMQETAEKWMKIIKKKEKPDLVIGVFHSGSDALLLGGKYRNNASVDVARNVPGFDIVLIGHDHQLMQRQVVNVAGDSVLVMNPAYDGMYVASVDVTLKLRRGKVVDKQIEGRLIDTSNYEISQDYMAELDEECNAVKDFVSMKVGHLKESMSSRSAFFGPSAIVDLIHKLQLNITKADISLSAPMSNDVKINKGELLVSDLFNLYKYENLIYAMNLTGKEVKGVLELSYARWTNQMKTPDDDLLLLRKESSNGAQNKFFLQNVGFNFDSAAGIIYTVDVTKPIGDKINIISMADGSPFSMVRSFKVALNSYRGNGGGELLTKGAGIDIDELKNRIVYSTDRDMRFYLLQYIKQEETVEPQVLNQWKFIPEEWTEPAAKKNHQLLFGNVDY